MSARRKPRALKRWPKAELDARYKPSDKAAYKARVAKADADYEVAREKCDDLSGNAKDVCVKDAKAAHVSAKENAKVARAAAKPADNTAAKQADVAEARKDAAAEKNEANYKAAKERCDALSGDVKSKCVDDASACTAKAERATDRGAGGRSAACPPQPPG